MSRAGHGTARAPCMVKMLAARAEGDEALVGGGDQLAAELARGFLQFRDRMLHE